MFVPDHDGRRAPDLRIPTETVGTRKAGGRSGLHDAGFPLKTCGNDKRLGALQRAQTSAFRFGEAATPSLREEQTTALI